jgi:large subunit ribosomal protein L4
MSEVLTRLKVGSTVILMSKADASFTRSARNLKGVKLLNAGYLNVRDLLGYEYVLLPKSALEAIENYFGAADSAPEAGE